MTFDMWYGATKSSDKNAWTVEDWEDLHRIKHKHRKNYKNAAIAYENKKLKRQIEKSLLYKALCE